MFSWLNGGNKGNKKKSGKKKNANLLAVDENKLIGIEFQSASKKGTGTKKQENQDAYCINDTQAPEVYFFAVLDGHGNLGKEGNQ